MAYADCLAAIRGAFRGQRGLTDDDIEFIVEELQDRQRRRGSRFSSSDENWKAAAEQFAGELRETAIIERRNRKINIMVKRRLLNLAHAASERYGDPSLGIEAAMVGILRPLPGGRNSVDARGQALFNQYMGGIVADLDRAGLLVHLNSGHLDLDIARALEKLTKPDARGTTNQAAIRIAEVVHKYRRIALDRQNKAGAWIKPLRGYVVRQAHDMHKVRRAGFEQWSDDVIPLIDEERTFAGVENPDQFLREAHTMISNGETLRAASEDIDLKLAFKGPGNLGKRISRHRYLHFKDADAWNAYNQKYGTNSLREALVTEFDHAARNAAIMEGFGSNPRAMFDEVLERLRQEYRSDPAKADRLRRSMLQAYMNVIDGTNRIPVNPTMAKVGHITRAVQSMAKLGGAAISSISDVANKAAMIRYYNGDGILSPIAQSVTSFFDGLPKQNRMIAAELAGVGLDGQIGDIAARFSVEDGISGATQSAMRLFFKLNLLTGWTDRNKTGLGLLFARHLAMQAEHGFDQLPDRMRLLLGNFGLDRRHWEIARRGTRRASDGRVYLFPDEIRAVSDQDMIAAGLQPAARETIATSMRAMIIDIVEAGVPTPGAKERAMLTLGLQPGTAEGEAARFISQFKAFPVTVATKTLGRLIYANEDGRADKVGLATFIASATILGYAALAMKDLVKGRTPRDPLAHTTWIAAMVQGGGAGIFGDFFLGETNRFGRSLLDTLAGPTLGTIADIDELRAKLMAGDDSAATALRLAVNNTPYLNLFYARTALDYLVLYQLQEAMNPGYLRRAERRMLKEQNQTYLLPPPSQVIPRGGGSRFAESLR